MTRLIKWAAVSVVFGALAAHSVTAHAQSLPDVSGYWSTDYGAVLNAPPGHVNVQIVQRGTGTTWTSETGDTYVCVLDGYRCDGTWTSAQSAGWFSVRFAPDGDHFTGWWGYGQDRSQRARWTGSQ